jgi:ribose transport system substrate-binding protein
LSGFTTAGEGSQAKRVRLAFFSYNAANSYARAQQDAVEATAKKNNATVKVFDGKLSAENQLKQIQDATASGQFDGFLIFPNDGAALSDVTQQAIGKGIKVVSLYTSIGPVIDSMKPQLKGIVGQVINPFRGNGIALAQATIRACGKQNPCEVIYVAGYFGIPLDALKFKGFTDTIKSHKNIKLVGRGEAGYLREEGYKVGQNLLQANRGVDVYVTSGDQMTFGAELAAKDLGIEKDIQFIGNGAGVEAVQAIKEGRWHSTYVFMPYTESVIGMNMLIAAIRGDRRRALNVDMRKRSPVGLFVTKENAAKFKPEFRLA